MATELWASVHSRIDPTRTCRVVADVNQQNGNLNSLTVYNDIILPERVVARIDWTTGQEPTVVDPVPVGTTTVPKGQAQKVSNVGQWSLALVRG